MRQSKANRIRGLKAAVTAAQRAVDANRTDIAYGLPYQQFLAKNEARLRLAELKLWVELKTDVAKD